MLEFTVNQPRIQRYISKYFQYEAEEYFDVEDAEESTPDIKMYSIHESGIDFNYDRFKPAKGVNDVKDLVAFSIDDLKYSDKLREFDEFLFLVFYIAASRHSKSTLDVAQLLPNYKIINLLQSLILIKEHGLHNLEFIVRRIDDTNADNYARFTNMDEYYSSITYYLNNLSLFVGENIPIRYNTDGDSLKVEKLDVESLKLLIADIATSIPNRLQINEVKGTLMLRDYLSDHFNIKSKGIISDKQIAYILEKTE
ncbi:MAG: hypothetical protein V4708_06385 [Bacteroidota bacterium]